MTAIPNELTININTSIPGFQKIKFKPSMLIKDISKDDSTVIFDPLIKYSQSEINQIPENLRKKEFFNKGLFQSLVNHLNLKQIKIPATKEGIKEATRKGYIDNNIRITLNNIFNEGSVINIGGQSYVIADIQWTNGDWKISTKKKEEIDSSKITDPYLKQVIVKDEIISGEKELNELPPEVVYGSSFTGQKNIDSGLASGIKTPTATVATPSQEPDKAKDKAPVPASVKKDDVIEPTIPFNKSKKSTYSLQYFFKQNDYYGLLNSIFRECDTNTKTIIQNYLNKVTSIKMVSGSQNLSKSAYLESVENLAVIENTGGGDCFFIAVADAINYYNYYNQDNRIIIGRYGKETNLFTQLVLREIVYNYISNWSDLDNYLKNVVPVNVDELNAKFAAQLNTIKAALRSSGSSDYISPDNYLQIANDIYIENENFLVKSPKAVPIDISNYEKPFTALLKSEIKDYILSNNYWANQMAIIALCSTLKLNIIPIGTKKNTNLKTILYIPFANFSTSNNEWNKYLFLYYNHNHYELITFNTATKVPNYADGVRKGVKINLSKITILERTPSTNLNCPLYLLFLIFGCFYSTIAGVDDKNNFTFYRDLMIEFENSMITPTNNNKKFNDTFIEYFPDNKINILPPPPVPTSTKLSPPSIKTSPSSTSTKLSSPPPLPPPLPPPPPPVESTISSLKARLRNPSISTTSSTTRSSSPSITRISSPSTTRLSSPSTTRTSSPSSNPVSPLTEEDKNRLLRIQRREMSKSYRGPKSALKDSSIIPVKKNVTFKIGGAPNYRPNYYRPNYYNLNYRPGVVDNNKTNLSYIIDIYMELHPGTTMSEEERKELKCNSKWNAIRKSYADFVGKPYVIPPLYKKYNKTLKASNNPNVNNPNVNNPNINKNNITRKQIQ